MNWEFEVYKRLVTRWDAYAQQDIEPNEKGSYGYRAKKQPLTEDIINKSLVTEQVTIGAYTIKPVENTVTNPQIDIDNHDGKTNVPEIVRNIFKELQKRGLYPYIEASSGKLEMGAHVAMVCKPTPAKICRVFLEDVLRTLGLTGHEIFPKQDKINDNGFGNLVKLPWQFNNRTKLRSEIINPATMQPFERKEAVVYMLALHDSDLEGCSIPDDRKNEQTTEIELKKIMAKCRHCFRDVIQRKPDMHGAEGREYMLAVSTDLKAAGATDAHIKRFARLMYGKEYDEARTLNEWHDIDASKTWRCETLKAKLPAYVTLDDCEKWKCEDRRDGYKKNIASAAFKPLADITRLGIAEDLQRQTPIHFDKSGNFWIWMEDHYERIDETDVLNMLRQIIDERHILGRAKPAIMDAIKMTGRMRTVKHVPKTWIHIQGAIIDVVTGERINPSPDYFLVSPIPHKLGLSRETPTIDRLFTEWVGAENKKLLYEICAYCLLDDYPIHRLFLLFGRGRNGKGQFKEIVVRFVGYENTTSTSIEGLIRSRFESAKLYKRKVATIGETNFTVLEDTAIIKMLTGGDVIPGEYKNKMPFEFYNTAKLLINTNSLPPTTDKTDAFYSRVIIVQFPNQFQKGIDIVDTIPTEEYDNLLLKCTDILKSLLERGEFTNEGTIQDKAQAYEAVSNPLNEFICDKCCKDVNGVIPVWTFVKIFSEYLGSRGLRQLSDKDIRKQLETNGYELEPNYRFKEYDGKQWTALHGLKWKN